MAELVARKGSQGLDYAEVWLLVIDMEVIIGLDLIEAGFAKTETEVPPNCKRLYLLPASNRRDIECIMLGS